MTEEQLITVERLGRVLLIGLNRPQKRNAFTVPMLRQLSAAYGELERDDRVRAGVLFAHGEHFTAGLDLAEVGPLVAAGELNHVGDGVDPWDLSREPRQKPLVAAVQGVCFTAGVELILAADVRVAADNARFAQMEVQRGLFPWAGATVRFVHEAGWGNAMRWILTGDQFGATEAHRIGLVQEVVDAGTALEQATTIAARIADQAPLAVRGARRSARTALLQGHKVALEALEPDVRALFETEDVSEGVASFLERRPARFSGR
jgi:enoyl-CoA hydratase/carnithine racemase